MADINMSVSIEDTGNLYYVQRVMKSLQQYMLPILHILRN